MYVKQVVGLFAVAMLAWASGCSTAPKSSAERADLKATTNAKYEELMRVDPGLKFFMSKCYGYALFPSVGKGGLIVGGAYGKGEVFEQGEMIGYCDLSQASIGAQIGGQTYTELIAFQDKASMDKFKKNELTFAAQASAVALKSGASADAKFQNGVAVFTMPNAGAMLEASIGGQSFTFQPKDTAEMRNK
jgi:lipid-binding SYLF domain-containing protein